MIQLTIRAHPGARGARITLLPDGILDVRVRAPALDGRANAAILRAVADALRLRRGQVRLLRGERSREKLLEIDLPNADELGRRLAAVSPLERA